MIAIVAQADDRVAMETAARWHEHNARLLLPRDLSTSGWRLVPGDAGVSVAVIGGEHVPCDAIDAVVTRLHMVDARTLPHIAEADREYAAQEMTAMLLAWLASLRCPVVNRPTPYNLMGPAWHVGDWRAAAVRAGFALAQRDVVRMSATDTSGSVMEVGVVGGHIVDAGNSDPDVAACAARLAHIAGCELLTMRLARNAGGFSFLDAHPSANLTDERTADALLEYIACTQIAEERTS